MSELLVGRKGSGKQVNFHPNLKFRATFAACLIFMAKASKTRKTTRKAQPVVKQNEPIILVTNDDGITAPGIKNLVEAVKHLGKVVVVAPDKPQSGMGHAITIGSPLRLHAVNAFEGIEAYQCTGTPVDCVKLAVDKVLHRKPDLCVSGINHGANHSINVIYSGTMSAAVEAAIESIPSIGFSLLDYSIDADFTGARHYARQIVEHVLKTATAEKHLVLNVNFPAVDLELIKGVKICRQAYAKYEEDFMERNDPHGKKYFWLTGDFVNLDKGTDTDVWALENNYVSVVP
ncbi:MAG: 5'/3'-nucleotidase SurE, partial [Chitinophagaceae bacterium]